MDLTTQALDANPPKRNPGPSWGYGFLQWADRLLPEILFKPLRAVGTVIAMACMPVERRHSRNYLAVILPNPPTQWDVFRHFLAFEEALMAKLRIANGRDIPCDFDPTGSALQAWMADGGPILLGTFHLGVSDMLGFQLGSREKRRVHLVRHRVENSHDTERLAEISGGCIQFIWSNEAPDLVFALKAAADSGDAIAMQCDRIENAAVTAPFEFFGARRAFPITIYRLARILRRPVILAVGVTVSPWRSRVYGSPLFGLVPGESRERFHERSNAHFQDFLRLVEKLLRRNPFLWFNFIPMNPTTDAESPPTPLS